MSAEVFEEVAYSAYCDDCEWQSEIFESKTRALHEAEAHDEVCEPEEVDPEDDRDAWLSEMDALVEATR